MNFWELDSHDPHPACHDQISNSTWTYGEVAQAVSELQPRLPAPVQKPLGFVFAQNRVGALLAYLAALRQQHAVCLANPQLNRELSTQVVQHYCPEWIVQPDILPPFAGYKPVSCLLDRYGFQLLVRIETPSADTLPIHPELAVLLTTSGSTGSPKLVRLSYRNVQANATSIVSYLGLNSTERPVTSLPLFYSYGLSVINSHLLASATLLLTDSSVVEKPFWQLFQDQRASSLAGVPYTYVLLHRLRFQPSDYPACRTLTQAGGRLEIPLMRHFEEICGQAGVRFFVMYGQTEATARISYVPPEKLSSKLGSIGLAIPNGKLSLDADSNEIIYEGSNVMLGYATCRADLTKGDECNGQLRTGDIGRQDEDGFFYITGRLKRFIKLFGQRLNLDEMEASLNYKLPAPVVCHGSDDRLLVLTETESVVSLCGELLARDFGFHPSAFTVQHCTRIPRSAAGKVDYQAIAEAFVL